jgi:DNA-binding Lrp family transcriptional regulator
MLGTFPSSYWGKLEKFELPHSIVRTLSIVRIGQLVLTPAPLAVLLVLHQRARQWRASESAEIRVKITLRDLESRTGYSKNIVSKATRELGEKQFIQRVTTRSEKEGQFGVNEYVLLNPETGNPLPSTGGTQRGNYLYSKQPGSTVRYLTLPVCIVKEVKARWSLANMTGSEKRLYVTLCWLGNESRRKDNGNQFITTVSELRRVAALSTVSTMQKALNGLENKALISVIASESGDELRIQMHDPYTGEPPYIENGVSEDDPSNYYAGVSKKRLNLNTGDSASVRELVRSSLPEGGFLTEQSNGDFMIRCPFHSDSTPSCSVSSLKRCFNCFGCKETGTVMRLLMKLRAVSPSEAIQLLGQSVGAEAEYHDPDGKAEAIYTYKDKWGAVIKQVRRLPGKKFDQRRPAKGGGWIWNLDTAKPLLYNLFELQHAGVVCITEGEKDATKFMQLGLVYGDVGTAVVATTSGGADSWRDELADELVHRRVIVMPDDDAPGAEFARKVVASLTSRNIEYRVVGFGDTGAKDLSEFIERGNTREELVKRIGEDWVSTHKEAKYRSTDTDDEAVTV